MRVVVWWYLSTSFEAHDLKYQVESTMGQLNWFLLTSRDDTNDSDTNTATTTTYADLNANANTNANAIANTVA